MIIEAMKLRSELQRIWRTNKANPNREKKLLDVCLVFMPEEKKNALTYIKVVEWIDRTWREFADENSLDAEAFKDMIKSKHEDIASLLRW